MPPRGRPILSYPLINKNYEQYIGRHLEMPASFWGLEGGEKFNVVVTSWDPSHKFTHGPHQHALSVKETDPLNAADRAAAPPLDDPEYYERTYWVNMKSFSQWHHTSHQHWNVATCVDETPQEDAAAITMTVPNQAIVQTPEKGRKLQAAVYRHFPPPRIDDGLGAPAPGVDNQCEYETYTSSASSASNQEPKQGKIFICNIDVPGAFGARRTCGCKIKIIDGEEADRAAHAPLAHRSWQPPPSTITTNPTSHQSSHSHSHSLYLTLPFEHNHPWPSGEGTGKLNLHLKNQHPGEYAELLTARNPNDG